MSAQYGDGENEQRQPGDPQGDGYLGENQTDPYQQYNGGSPPDAPLAPGKGWEWNGSRWTQVDGRGRGYNQPPDKDHASHYNNGSPPDIPLDPGKGWEWNGTRWIQVAGRGLGYTPAAPAGGGGGGSAAPPAAPASAGTGTPIAGVPASYAKYSGTSMPTGSVPTLASAITASKALPGAPAVSPYAEFQAPEQVGVAARNNIVNAILGRPETMDQTAQDQLFEQQKEQESLMASQARNRLAQSSVQRGIAAGGGTQMAGDVKLESDFMNSLLQGRRDITLKANDINRQNQLAAVEMANAVNQGDFARAQAAYQTQLEAKKAYDELRFRAAEFDRGNVALAAQTEMAGRQQQTAESMAGFQQYLDQLKFDEMMRQFNEQLAYNYGTFGWNQQMDLANMFPK